MHGVEGFLQLDVEEAGVDGGTFGEIIKVLPAPFCGTFPISEEI